MDRRIQLLLANPERLLKHSTVSVYDRTTLKHMTLRQKIQLLIFYLNNTLPKTKTKTKTIHPPPRQRRQLHSLNTNVLLKKAIFLRGHRKGRYVKVTPAHRQSPPATISNREVEIVVRPQRNHDALPVAFRKRLISSGFL